MLLARGRRSGIDDPAIGTGGHTDSCGRSRCVDHDPRSAGFNAARTEANEPSSNPTVENERSAQHREYGVSLRAHCPSPCYLIKGSTEAKPDRHQTNLIFGSKCGRAQDKNYKLLSFSRCVAWIQLGPEITVNLGLLPKWKRLLGLSGSVDSPRTWMKSIRPADRRGTPVRFLPK